MSWSYRFFNGWVTKSSRIQKLLKKNLMHYPVRIVFPIRQHLLVIAQPPWKLYILDPLRGDNTHIFDWFTGRISSSSPFPLSTTICVLHVGEYTIYRLVYSLFFAPDLPQFTPDQLTRGWKGGSVRAINHQICVRASSRYHMTLHRKQYTDSTFRYSLTGININTSHSSVNISVFLLLQL